MKELSIEEKAKRYDEALKVLHKYDGANIMFTQDLKEEMFPELIEESEDEKIRKSIIAIINNYVDNSNTFKPKMIAWLEKQGDKDKLIKELGEYKAKYTKEVLEKHLNNMSNKDDERLRKTTISFLKEFADKGYENAVECIDWLNGECKQKFSDKAEPKFNVGQTIIYKGTENIAPTKMTISDIAKGQYWDDNCCIVPISDQDNWELVEQKPAENKGMNLDEEEMTPFQKKVFCIIDTTIEEEQGLKQVCDELLALAYNEIKKNPTEWSEENEKMLNDIIMCGEHHCHLDAGNIAWLKSLKERVQPQNTWLPSDEQMKVLEELVEDNNQRYFYTILRSLYEQLKKLKN